MAKLLFEHLDCYVDIAQTATKALEYFLERSYQLIVMTIGLPDQTGLELTEEIRKLENQSSLLPTPIIGLGPHRAKVIRHQALEAGMNAYFIKPLSLTLCRLLLDQFALKAEQPKVKHLS